MTTVLFCLNKNSAKDMQPQSTHRVAIATFWRMVHMMEKLAQPGEYGGVHAQIVKQFKHMVVKTRFCHKRSMQTGSSETFIGSNYVSMGPNLFLGINLGLLSLKIRALHLRSHNHSYRLCIARFIS
jgi:hypothetical protein